MRVLITPVDLDGVFMIFLRIKLLLTCCLLLALSPLSYAASCQAVKANESLPQVINKDQCFELQGGNVLSTPIAVKGRLFIKAGRSVEIKAPGYIIATDGGQFTIRGRLTLDNQTQLNVDHLSSLNNTGEIVLYSASAIKASGKSKLKNLGQIYVHGSSFIELSGKTDFSNSGIIDFAHARLQLNHNAKLSSKGTILFNPNSRLVMNDEVYLHNDGTFKLLDHSYAHLTSKAHFFSRNPLKLDGEMILKSQSILETNAGFDLSANATLLMSDAAQLTNRHNFEILGRVHLSQSARFLNEGKCQISQSGSLVIANNAVFINTGTFRDDHKNLHISNSQSFINKNIVYGQDPRANSAR